MSGRRRSWAGVCTWTGRIRVRAIGRGRPTPGAGASSRTWRSGHRLPGGGLARRGGGQRVLPGPAPAALIRDDLAVDEDFTAPHAPGFLALERAFEAFRPQRAGPAQGLRPLEVRRVFGEPKIDRVEVLARQGEVEVLGCDEDVQRRRQRCSKEKGPKKWCPSAKDAPAGRKSFSAGRPGVAFPRGGDSRALACRFPWKFP